MEMEEGEERRGSPTVTVNVPWCRERETREQGVTNKILRLRKLWHTQKSAFGAAYTKVEPLIVFVAVANLRPINYDDAGRRKAERECVQSDKAGRMHMNLMDVSKVIRTLMHLKKKKERKKETTAQWKLANFSSSSLLAWAVHTSSNSHEWSLEYFA